MAMEISGHKTEPVYRRDDIVSQQDMKLAAAKMEKLLERAEIAGNHYSGGKTQLMWGLSLLKLGWVEGFEPSATGTTIRRSTS
jgi:hypothetical protein